jgi:hypothetical protein
LSTKATAAAIKAVTKAMQESGGDINGLLTRGEFARRCRGGGSRICELPGDERSEVDGEVRIVTDNDL